MTRLAIFTCLALTACAPSAAMTHGIPNFRVVDATAGVYRGGQPTTADGWAYLRSLGVAADVKLNYDTEGNDDGAKAAGITIIYLPTAPSDAADVLGAPSQDALHRGVDAMRAGKVYIHCEHGQDRTGLQVAAYRMTIDGWSRSKARREAIADGFHVELLGLDDALEDYKP